MRTFHHKLAKLFAGCALLLTSGFALADTEAQTVHVGFGGFNSFTFSVPVETLVFPPMTPIKGKTLDINGKQTMLVQFEPTMKEPAQMVVSLTNGSVISFTLVPDAGASPVIWKQATFANTNEARVPIQRPEDVWLKDTFYSLVEGRMPDGFSRIRPPDVGSMGDLTADYIAAFRNDNYVLLVARLNSNKLQWISPQDLYVPGVKAVLIDGDRVGVKDAPIAYILIAGAR